MCGFLKFRHGILGAACSILAALVVSLFLCLNSGCGKSSEKKTGEVVIWHWMTDRNEAFNLLAQKYKELTGIDIKFELYAPSESYKVKTHAAAQTNTLPDVFGVLGEKKDLASFIKAGFITDITSYMRADNNKWADSFYPKALINNEFKEGNGYGVTPGIYGVPIDVTNIQLLYNKKLFKNAGLDPDNPPQTWDEFVAAGKKLLSSGSQVLIAGFGEIWMIDCLASNFAWNLMGEEKIIATIRGEVKYTDPDWLVVLGCFEEMYKNNLIAKGAGAMINKVAEQNFANERSAIALNGSWCVNVYGDMNPSLDYGVMLPPKISDAHPRAIWGGAGSSFMINSNSIVKDQAVEFLKWMTDVPQQIFLIDKTRNLPSNKNCISKIKDMPVLAKFIDKMDLVVNNGQLPMNEYPRVIEALDMGMQSIIVGEKTPMQIAEYVQQVKDREMNRGRR